MLIETLLILLGTITPYNDAQVKKNTSAKTQSEVVGTQQSSGTTNLRGGWDRN